MISPKIIDSWVPWNILLVLWCIHWDEISWYKWINFAIEDIERWEIKLTKGKIIFLPICNPFAYEKNVRFIDQNLNRIIREYENPENNEQKLANEICKYIKQADYVLDLHSMESKWTPFVFQDYDDEKTNNLAKSLRIRDIIKWWPEMYEDTWDQDTIAYAHSLWKIGIIVECWSHLDRDSIDIAYASILYSLSHFWLIDTNWSNLEEYNIATAKKIYYKKSEWKLVDWIVNFSKVKKGDTIGIYNNWELEKAEFDWFVLLPKSWGQVWEEFYYLWENS